MMKMSLVGSFSLRKAVRAIVMIAEACPGDWEGAGTG